MSTRRFAKDRKQNTELVKDQATRLALDSLSKRIREIEDRMDSPAVAVGSLATPEAGQASNWPDNVPIVSVSIKSTATPILLFATHLSQYDGQGMTVKSAADELPVLWFFIRASDGVVVNSGAFYLTNMGPNLGQSHTLPVSMMMAIDKSPPAGVVKYELAVLGLNFPADLDIKKLSLVAARLGS